MKVYHVLPINDLKEHSEDDDILCWCKSTVEDHEKGQLIIHNSMDGREKYETGKLRYP